MSHRFFLPARPSRSWGPPWSSAWSRCAGGLARAGARRHRRDPGGDLRGVRRGRWRLLGLPQRLRRALQPHRRGDQRRRHVGAVPLLRRHRQPHRCHAAVRLRPGEGLLPRRPRRRYDGRGAAHAGRDRVDGDERHGRHRVPGRPDHRPDRAAHRLGHRQPGGHRPRRLRQLQHLREGRRPRPPAPTTSVARDAAGKDTDDNSADLTVAAGTPGAAPAGRRWRPDRPRPRRTRSPRSRAPATPARSWAGRVVTDGVVTAAYPTGGLNGFYLQTAGTGGDTDSGDPAGLRRGLRLRLGRHRRGPGRRPRRGHRQGQRVQRPDRGHTGGRVRRTSP